jgi:hypothetical protein
MFRSCCLSPLTGKAWGVVACVSAPRCGPVQLQAGVLSFARHRPHCTQLGKAPSCICKLLNLNGKFRLESDGCRGFCSWVEGYLATYWRCWKVVLQCWFAAAGGGVAALAALTVVRRVGARRVIQLAPGDISAACGYSAFTAAPARADPARREIAQNREGKMSGAFSTASAQPTE